MGLNIDPDSIKVFQDALANCNAVIWNSPMGVFEFDKFAAGTEAIACNQKTSKNTLQQLAQDGNRIVRATAKESLEKYY